MEPTEPVNARFEIREELARDPRFVRRRAFDRHLECEVLLEQPGEAVVGRLGTADGAKALREARMLARIRHPRVIRLREVVELDGLPTLVLDPVAGDRLDQVLASQPRLAPDVIVRLGRQLAQASHAVHAEGVVHRGIAPENVVIDPQDGGAVLAGFTFAKPIDVRVAQSSLDHRLREKGGAAVRGLPVYAAPEQIAGQPADHRADVFALGCLLYRCATGREAFPEDAVSYDAPPPPRQVERSIPRGLSDAIRKCISHSPTARFPNMLAVDEALAALEAAPASAGKRNRLIGVAGAVALVALVAWQPWLGDDTDYAEPGEYQDQRFVPRGMPNPANHDPVFRARRAVLVGINYDQNPDHDDLKEAENDVDAIHAQLVELGWRDTPDEDPTDEIRRLVGPNAEREAILDALDWAREVDREGQVFVYLAGHGQLDETDTTEGYFIPADGKDRSSSWVFLKEITVPLRAPGGPKHVLIALDCCHAGAAMPAYRGNSRTRREAYDEIPLDQITERHVRRRARVLLTSALAHEKAADESPFAAGFLRGLKRAAAGTPVTTSLLYSEIHKAVVDREMRQCCWRTDFHGEDADFVFLPRR